MSDSSPVRVFWMVLALLFIFPAEIPAASPAEQGVLFSEDLQLKIAERFLEQGEYYRAVTEYWKLLILFPESRHVDYALLKIGVANVRGEEYRDAMTAFTSLRERYPRSEHVPEAWYLEGLVARKLRQPSGAGAAFSALAAAYPQSEYAPKSLVAAALVALETGQAAAGGDRLRTLIERYPDYPAPGQAQAALALLEGYDSLPRKSPFLAGTLSAVLPGSGYFYAGRYGDGMTALFLNALFVAAEVISIREENYPLAAIVGVIGLPFYAGNVYGSAKAAEKWNVSVRRELEGRVSVVLGFRF